MTDYAPNVSNAYPLQAVISTDAFTLGHIWRMVKIARALDEGRPSFGYHREWEYQVEDDVRRLLDDLASSAPSNAHRLSDRVLLLQVDGALVEIRAFGLTTNRCTVTVEVSAADRPSGERAVAPIQEFFGRVHAARNKGFILEWYHRDAQGILQGTAFEERVEEVLRDEAYPGLDGGVEAFIRRYLDASEPVLVLQGPPGTGKTQLIRGILSALAERQSEDSTPRVLYSSDPAVLQSDDYFIRFRERGPIAMVVEDADHFLAPRSDGNATMHRFLNASDGLLRAGARKVIFSTNLPRAADIDEALLRPGRCHAHVRLRALTTDEARALACALTGRAQGVGGTIAEIYRHAAAVDHAHAAAADQAAA